DLWCGGSFQKLPTSVAGSIYFKGIGASFRRCPLLVTVSPSHDCFRCNPLLG
ncbi:hypothetical protein ACH5RR_029260, partial [Cinchona calisaya]